MPAGDSIRMPSYVVHLGPIKTGSSYMQVNLVHLKDQLAADGIVFPDTWRNFDWRNHGGISFQIKEGLHDELRDGFAQLNASGARTVILSSEGLYSLSPKHIDLLKGAIGDHPVRVVYYCRRWSDRLPSIWNQAVKAGQTRTLPEFVDSMFARPMEQVNINYSLVFRRFAHAFGRDSVVIVPFDRLREARTDITEHFLREVVGWHAPFTLPKAGEANTSQSVVDAELIRSLHLIRVRRIGSTDAGLAQRFMRRRSELELEELARIITARQTTLAIDDSDPRLEPSWEAMKGWEDRLVGGGEMFTRRVRQAPYVDPDWVKEAGARKLLRAAFEGLGLTKLKLRPTAQTRYERQKKNEALAAHRVYERKLKETTAET
jgi:hypothetical protein